LERAVRESLRVLPAVGFVIRRAARPAVLAGRPIPEGTVVVLSLYVTHHQPRSFAEPERFWPDRWIDRPASPYAYLPFGAGPRMCVGTAFSLQLLQLAVPAVLTRFRLGIAPGTRVDRHSSLTMGVAGGLPVRVLAQDGRFATAALTGDIHEMVTFPQAEPMRRAA
jgi:cytochrome P450